jgi:(S)-2-hydroxyglutarate dehydrogenase
VAHPVGGEPVVTASDDRFDVGVVGGGIIGLATAHRLSQLLPDARIVVLEKEDGWARHQTGRNSGVIHSGIYYPPGSLKAELCRAGSASMVAFATEHGIAHEVCGKLVVATTGAQVPALHRLYERGLANGLPVRLITAEQARDVEPHIRAVAAIRVESTGIIDYAAVCRTLARLAGERGVVLRTGAEVVSIDDTGREHRVGLATGETIALRFLVTCGGLHSDRLAELAGARPDARIVPFRGEYYELREDRRHLVEHLVYPVPNPEFPFLGVHFTRGVDGSVHAGPNAVLALRREGYTKRDVRFGDVVDTVTFPGFWRLARRHWRDGAAEVARSLSKAHFTRSLQELCPEVTADDLVPAEAGVRAQALRPDGRLVDDFLFVDGPRAVHVCNAPSPAATASLEIADRIAGRLVAQAGLRDVRPPHTPGSLTP